MYRRLGESLRHETAEWSSPTRMTGLLGSGLKARRVSLALRTTFCSHMASFLFSARSKTCTLPSAVHAAKVVLDHGVHATSPTGVWRAQG